MKTDLLKDYFRRDLTEAEEAELADLIARSPEASLKFAEQAKRSYLRTGLPNPDPRWWTRVTDSTSFKIIGGLVVGTAVVLALHSGSPKPIEKPMVVATPAPTISVPVTAVGAGSTVSTPVGQNGIAPTVVATTLVPTVPGGTAVSTTSAPVSANPPKVLSTVSTVVTQVTATTTSTVKKAAAKPKTHSRLAKAKKPSQSATPVTLLGMVQPLAYDPKAKYAGLDLIVQRTVPGLVTIRLLNSADTEVRLLYAGFLKKGKWTFPWDGKLANGDYAQPGLYEAQVESDGQVLTKQIVIQSNIATAQSK